MRKRKSKEGKKEKNYVRTQSDAENDPWKRERERSRIEREGGKKKRAS